METVKEIIFSVTVLILPLSQQSLIRVLGFFSIKKKKKFINLSKDNKV